MKVDVRTHWPCHDAKPCSHASRNQAMGIMIDIIYIGLMLI